jgi:hypothetical protein
MLKLDPFGRPTVKLNFFVIGLLVHRKHSMSAFLIEGNLVLLVDQRYLVPKICVTYSVFRKVNSCNDRIAGKIHAVMMKYPLSFQIIPSKRKKTKTLSLSAESQITSG